jgi:hypothetical protein
MKNNYPNTLEMICGAVFAASMFATGISGIYDSLYNNNELSPRTLKLVALDLASCFGAFRREDYAVQNAEPKAKNYI